jgi:hypothetical protein
VSDRRGGATGVGVDGTQPHGVTQIRHGVTNLERFPPSDAASQQPTRAPPRARRQTADPRADTCEQRVTPCSPLVSLSTLWLWAGSDCGGGQDRCPLAIEVADAPNRGTAEAAYAASGRPRRSATAPLRPCTSNTCLAWFVHGDERRLARGSGESLRGWHLLRPNGEEHRSRNAHSGVSR